jgi:predicted amidophosphoribosyltransferase
MHLRSLLSKTSTSLGWTFRSVADETSSTLRDAALTLLFPAICRVCDRIIESWHNGVACDVCWLESEQNMELMRAAKSFCLKCGMPLAALPSQIPMEERKCGRCDELGFGFARACGVYRGALRECVLWMKAHPQLPGRLRSHLKSTFLNLSELQSSDSIIPVPLSSASGSSG